MTSTLPTTCTKDGLGLGHLAGFLRGPYTYATGIASTVPAEPIRFKIDGQETQDRSLDFCHIYAEVGRNATTRLTLRLDNPPLTEELRELVTEKGGKVVGDFPECQVEFPLAVNEVTFLRKLARAFRRIVGRGGRYENPNWKWVCPRTADSLDRFADHLMKYRSTRRHEPGRISGSPPSTDLSKSANTPPAPVPVAVPTSRVPTHLREDDDIFCRLGIQ